MARTRRELLSTVFTIAFATCFTDRALSQGYKPAQRDLSKGNTLYVVPYAHLDTQWRWAYPQVIREYVPNTLNRNFELIDRYPNYIFNFSGSRRYEFMRDYYPEEYRRLKRYVASGRWFPAGSSVDEADANVPSAESLIRQVLYGNRFFLREFGVSSQEFMLPDCFGFPYALPSILSHCGLLGFSTQKLTWGSALGIPFKVGTWEGPDGKKIIAALDPGSYAGDVDEDLSANTSWLARIQDTGRRSGAFVDYHYYGTGDIGGGPNDHSVSWVEKSIAGQGPVRVVSSQSDEMFKSLTPAQVAKLPNFKGELLLTQHSAGSITSQASMKRWNRKNELLADAAERASVAAMWLGTRSYPSERLYNAWDLVLGSQMHDMLPGTSIPKAYEFCWNDELLALNQFAAIETDAVGAVASQMDTRTDGTPLVVYNPLSIEREDVVEATLTGFGEGQPQAFDADGKRTPTQVLRRNGPDLTVLFLAKVPSCGFAVYDVRKGGKGSESEGVRVTDRVLENQRIRVRLSEGGDIASVFDKQEEREVLKSPSKLEFQYHNPSSFPAWNMDWEDAKRPPQAVVDGPAQFRILEEGPVRSAIQVMRSKNGSKFVQSIRLSAGEAGDRVEVATQIDWQTREHALKASFPMAAGNRLATYDLQVGTTRRGNNDEKKYEVPQHQWLDLTNDPGTYGAAILQDSRYGSDKPDDHTVRLTLLYTPGVRGGYGDQATQDFGRHDVLYAIAPHGGTWQQGGIPWIARRLNQPLRAYAVTKHAGPRGRRLSLLSTNSRRIEAIALKKSEEGRDVIVRLRELDGVEAQGVRVRFGDGIASAREVDGQERPIGPAQINGGELVTDVGANSLRAFRLSVGAREPGPGSRGVPLELPYDTDVASSHANPKDGSVNGHGEAYPAEQMPADLQVDGIAFRLGPMGDGQANAATANGQVLTLPAGATHLFVLAASANGDVMADFRIGERPVSTFVQSWDGYVGQWDNRLWNDDVGVNFTNYAEWRGLTPGYVKPAEVAWFSNLKRHPVTVHKFYEYTYLYKYGFEVPSGVRSLTLPNDPRVKVLAATVVQGTHPLAAPAAPLYDTLEDHRGVGAPEFSPQGGQYSDATQVILRPPLYWRKGSLRYTTDGSEPTRNSPSYEGPITLYSPTTLKAAEVSGDSVGPVATVLIEALDTTSPRLVRASSAKSLGVARVVFSEPVSQETAENPSSYLLSSGAKVVEAKLLSGRNAVELTLDRALQPGQSESITVTGVKDLSPTGNPVSGQTLALEEKRAVFRSPDDLKPATPAEFKPEGLPILASDTWTVNLFCKPDREPENLTLIGGFGRPVDGRIGTGRYFSKFAKGINFWICNRDVASEAPLDIGKWQMLTATFDGAVIRLYKNAELIAEEPAVLSDDRAAVHLMPVDAWDRKRIFPGSVRTMTIWNESLSPLAIVRLMEEAKRTLP